LRAEVDFADTDGMEPEDVTVRQRLLEVRVEAAEALKKTGKPVAAPPQSHEVIRRRQHEKNREQDVVKSAHSDVPNQQRPIFPQRNVSRKHAKNVSEL
jgi:hypothetical protein